MNKKKVITITTAMFEFKVFYNSSAVTTQLGLFIGMTLLWLFGSAAVHKLVTMIFIVNIIALLFIFLRGASIIVEDGEGVDSKSTPQTNKSKTSAKPETSIATNAEKDKKTTKKSSSKETSGTINNKVPIPTSTTVPVSTTPAPVVNKVEQPPVSSKSTQSTSIEEEQDVEKTLDNMTDEDWAALFKV